MASYLGNDLLMRHIDQYLGGSAPGGVEGLADFLRQHNVTPSDVAEALQATGRGDASTVSQFVAGNPTLAGWASGAPATAAAAPAAAPAGGYSAQQIKDYISSQGIGNDPGAIYRAAQQYGVGAGQIDGAMGYAPGTSASWVQQQGLAALPGAPGGGGGGMTLAPNPAGGYNTNQGVRPGTQQPGMPGLGAYPQNPGGNPYQPMAGGSAPSGQQGGPLSWGGGAQSPMPGANPYTAWMADTIGQRLGQNLQRNILPGIRSAASAAGGLGGSRQGIAEGIAIGDTMTGYGNTLAGLYSGQYNQDRNYGLQSDALDLNVYNANQNWMRQGQQDQLGLADRLLGWNQNYGVGNAGQVQNTPLNYFGQFTNMGAQLGGMGGSQSQNLQGNPYLGALGGAMTGANLWKAWGG